MSTSKTGAIVRRNSKKANPSGKVAQPTTAKPAAPKSARQTALPILPGEDARAYRGRLKAWTGSLEPRDAVEAYLVERAVVLSWQLDRADRAQVAHLTRMAKRIEPDQASQDGGDRWDRLAFDDGASVKRLREYQRTWSQALFRTLDAFSIVRKIDKLAGRAPDSAPAAPPTAIAVDRPAGVGLPVALPLATCGAPEPIQACHVSAALIDILTAAGSEAAPPMSDVTTAMVLTTPARLDGSIDEPEEARGRPAFAPRRRVGSRRIRQAPRSGSDGPDTTGPAPMGLRSRPIRREEHAPGDTPNPRASRRRVGGYAVPLDQTIPVTCADRIPVRLRRDASAARLAKAASCPSS